MGSDVSQATGVSRQDRGAWSVRTALSSMFYGASARRRRTLWHARVIESVRELGLHTPGITIDVLTSNPVFNAIVAEADQIAMQSSDEAKLQALLNTIQNCTLPGAPAISVQTFFLRFLKELTTTQLTVLNMLNNPREWLRARSMREDQLKAGTLSSFVQTCLAVVSAPTNYSAQIIRGLELRGLLQQHKIDTVLSRGNLLTSRTTALGREFLMFIQKPTTL